MFCYGWPSSQILSIYWLIMLHIFIRILRDQMIMPRSENIIDHSTIMSTYLSTMYTHSVFSHFLILHCPLSGNQAGMSAQWHNADREMESFQQHLWLSTKDVYSSDCTDYKSFIWLTDWNDCSWLVWILVSLVYVTMYYDVYWCIPLLL